MIGMNGIARNVLARMKSICPFRRKRCLGLAAQTGFACWLCGLWSFQVQQRQIVDRSRPGEFHVVERSIVTRHRGKPRKRHHQNDDVPQGRGKQRASRDFPLNPAIFEKSFAREFLACRRSAEDSCQITADPLLETSPLDIQFRRPNHPQTRRGGRRGSGLS